jgi:PAS domain S-box-containing protein
VARDFRSQLAAEGDPSSSGDGRRFLFESFARATAEAVISTDLDGIVTSWNDSAARMFGYSADEMVGNEFARIVPAKWRATETRICRNLASQPVHRYEAERCAKDLRRFQVAAAVSAVYDDDGKMIGALRMECAMPAAHLRDELQSRLAAIVESSNDAIISKNLDAVITSWNQAACRLFGHTAEEMIGQSILKIIPEDLHQEEQEILRKIKAGERIEHFETRRLRKDGAIVDVSLTISPVKDFNGKIVGSSKIARDISERKKMERLMIQSEKLAATGRMAATIAHEINNPLDSVTNLVYLARTGVAANSRVLPYLLTAERELDRVSHIARQTLGYYRDPGSPSTIHLEQLLEEVLSVYRFNLLAANVAVDCAFGHQQTIQASRDELMQIFSNLVLNAIDAMSDGGVLTITTREVGGDGIEISVRDKGTGITPENLERIFEPFFSTKGERGTGVGLWVARQLLEKRGGSINIASHTEFPRNGTTVTVFLPFKT